MSDPFLAMVIIFGGNYAPVNWAFCQGTLLSISANQALFSLVSNMYGGDGVNTFALPDLRGRSVIGIGQGTGLPDYQQGEFHGAENVVLQLDNLPTHSHTTDLSNLVVTPSASTAFGTTVTPDPTMVQAVLPLTGSGPTASSIKGYAIKNNSTTLAPSTITGSIAVSTTGNGSPVDVDIRNPYLAVNYIIALQGIFPNRS